MVALVSVHSRLYGDGPPWPESEMLLRVERTYRESFLAAARQAAQWDFPDVDAVAAAWEERNETRRRAEVWVPSSVYFGDPTFNEFEERGYQIIYRPGHEIDAARTRGQVQAFEIGAQQCRRNLITRAMKLGWKRWN